MWSMERKQKQRSEETCLVYGQNVCLNSFNFSRQTSIEYVESILKMDTDTFAIECYDYYENNKVGFGWLLS